MDPIIDQDNSQNAHAGCMVTVNCLTFNHAPYIKDTMDGFCLQQTSFPFVCLILDDASTDGEQEVIRQYMEEHFDLENEGVARTEDTDDYHLIFARHKANANCHFAAFLLKYNHHHKKDKGRYTMEWKKQARYNATCDGDDYWTHPQKLQRQFDLMEAHPEYSLCFHASNKLMPTGEMETYRPNPIKECYTPEEAIWHGGNLMATCSMFHRWKDQLKEGRPDFMRECPIGDLPLMLFHAAKGPIGYIDEVMSVYRFFAVGSWSASQNTLKKRLRHYHAIMKMYDQYDAYTHQRFHDAIVRKKQRISKGQRIDNVKSLARWILERLHLR